MKRIEQVYIIIFYSFFSLYNFLIYPWGQNYYYANIKAYYFIGIMLLLAFLHIFLSGKQTGKKFSLSESLLVLYLILIGWSTFHSQTPSLVGKGTQHQGIVIMFSCFLLFRLAARLEVEHVKKLCHLIIVSSFFAAVYGILQYYHLGFLPQDRVMKMAGRSFSFFDNADYFGSYLTLVIPLTVIGILLSDNRKRSILYWIIFCTQILSLLQSGTRSAWIGLIIGFILVGFSSARKKRRISNKTAMVAGVVFLIVIFSSFISHNHSLARAGSITDDLLKIVKNDDAGSAGSSRWYIWQVSMPLIEHHFWLGTGPNTFHEVFHPGNQGQVEKYLGDVNEIYDENNDYLQIALTMGVPALIVYLLFLSIVLKKGFQQLKELDERQQLVSYGWLAAVIGYLVQAFFNISVVSVAPFFWLLLGFLVNGNVRLQITVKARRSAIGSIFEKKSIM